MTIPQPTPTAPEFYPILTDTPTYVLPQKTSVTSNSLNSISGLGIFPSRESFFNVLVSSEPSNPILILYVSVPAKVISDVK